MTAAVTPTVLVPSLNRVDGRLKVTGTAAYPSDVTLPDLVHAVLVQSTVASGRIRTIATNPASRAPGVLAIFTHANAPALTRGPMTPLGPSPLPPLQSGKVLHYGQHVAMVVAERLEQADAAAQMIKIEYEPSEPILSLDDQRATQIENPWKMDQTRGVVSEALVSADVRVEAGYTTADNTHNPIGLFATVATWDGDSLTVHDTTQWPHGVRESLATTFGISPDSIRVFTPFVGGAFGAGLRVWPHVVLAVLAARETKRPVKLVLSRAQMFTSIGHRPRSAQRISIGATRASELVAIDHEATSSVGVDDDVFDPVTMGTPDSYRCPNLSVRDKQVRVSTPPPGWMRAPGHAEGSFALESALDELSYALGIDPLALRIRNYAKVHPRSGLPWSSNALLECYTQAAARFGWSDRLPTPRSMRKGRLLVGYGMAGVTYTFYQPPCKARASILRDGSAFVRSAATDIGTGTYTVMTLLAADILGLPTQRVRFGLGDTAMPNSPQQGGSGLTGALGNAVHSACVNLVRAFVDLVNKDDHSPLRGCSIEQVTVSNGRIYRTDEPTSFENYSDILIRHNLDELTIDGDSAPPDDKTTHGLTSFAARSGRFVPFAAQAITTKAPAGAFAAQFVEVHVDPDLGIVRVARVVAAVDGGRILNEKTARSQIIGGIVGGIGMALLEEAVTDGQGRLMNTSLGDYLVPVNADVPDIDVIFVGQPDSMTPIGTKGVGELALVGMGAAVANAVYHATGNRVRSLPILLEKVLAVG